MRSFLRETLTTLFMWGFAVTAGIFLAIAIAKTMDWLTQ